MPVASIASGWNPALLPKPGGDWSTFAAGSQGAGAAAEASSDVASGAGTVAGGAYTPAVSSDFEAGNTSVFNAFGYNLTNSTTRAYSGARSARFNQVAGSTGFGGSSVLPNSYGNGAEIWLRFRTYFDLGFNFAATPWLKFTRLDIWAPGPVHSGHIDCYIKGGGASAVGGFDFIEENADNNWWFNSATALPTGIIRGQWQTFEFYWKLGTTPETSRRRVWRDGVNIYDGAARRLLGNANQILANNAFFPGNPQGVAFSTYWNGAAQANASCYIDDWKIATSDSPPTLVDASGRPFIGLAA